MPCGQAAAAATSGKHSGDKEISLKSKKMMHNKQNSQCKGQTDRNREITVCGYSFKVGEKIQQAMKSYEGNLESKGEMNQREGERMMG